MKPSTELFNLINSLSKSEKRFFKLSSSLQTGEKNYLKLFDIIEKQTSYNEEAIKKTFAKENFIKHLPSEKNHLYKLILKSLRGFHADNSISSILKQEIKNVEILYRKALYKECVKFIKRAKKIANDHEKFYYLFELISWEKLLIEEAFEEGEFNKDLDLLIKEEMEVIEKLRNLAEYHMIYSRINYIFRSGGFSRNENERLEVDKIANHHLIVGKNTALSDRAASICYYIQGFCNATKRDFSTAMTKFKKTKAILDRNPLIKSDLPERYVRTLKNLVFCHIDNHDIKRAQELVDELNSLSNKKGFNSIDIRVKIFTASCGTQLVIYDKLGEYQKGLKLAEEMIKGMDEYKSKLNKEQTILFYYHIGYVYFGAGLYKESLKWVNKILNDNEQILRQDIYSFARLFNLILHYELGNIDLLEYIIKSTSRYLKKTEKDYQSEDVLIKYLKELIKLDNEIARIEIYEKAKAEFEILFKSKKEGIILQFIDVISWLTSKIENISFEQAIKNRSF
jgi:tetratricopeptide (TPR) repeat protein